MLGESAASPISHAALYEIYNSFLSYFGGGVSRTNPLPVKQYSVFARITAQLEQNSLYHSLNFDVAMEDFSLMRPGDAGTISPNATVLNTGLGVLLCPSNPATAAEGTPKGSSYRANYGVLANPTGAEDRCGPFTLSTPASARDITDVLSHTASYSEKVPGDASRIAFSAFADALTIPMGASGDLASLFDACANQPIVIGHYRTNMGTNWLAGGLSQTCYNNHMETPNGPRPDCLREGYLPAIARATARSFHPSGINVALADDSVRFVKTTINPPTWSALGSRAGMEGASREY